jgi:hypothetical protein
MARDHSIHSFATRFETWFGGLEQWWIAVMRIAS